MLLAVWPTTLADQAMLLPPLACPEEIHPPGTVVHRRVLPHCALGLPSTRSSANDIASLGFTIYLYPVKLHCGLNSTCRRRALRLCLPCLAQFALPGGMLPFPLHLSSHQFP